MTGLCYANTIALVRDLVRMKLEPDRLWLVHGIPTLSRPPHVQFGHAWVEYETESGLWIVFDHGRRVEPFPRELYYAVGKIEYVRRYSPTEMITLMDEFGSPGPWDERIAMAAHEEDFDIA